MWIRSIKHTSLRKVENLCYTRVWKYLILLKKQRIKSKNCYNTIFWLVHTWSILWTLFWLVQTGQCFVGSHLINLMNIILTCSDWTMFCWFTLDQSYEHYLDLFRLDNVLLVHTWSILWTLFGLVQTGQCFVGSHLINLMNIILTCSD